MKTSVRSMLVLATLACLPLLAHADDGSDRAAPVLSGDEITRALKPASPASSRTRGLTRRSDTPAPQSVSLHIPFKYNSSALEPAASDQLKQLALALNSDSLHNDRFVVAGHTDAKGNPRYNKQLSRKRAESVRRYLIANGVKTVRLDAVGYGSERPLTPERPEDPANRRVEIRDLGTGSAAE